MKLFDAEYKAKLHTINEKRGLYSKLMRFYEQRLREMRPKNSPADIKKKAELKKKYDEVRASLIRWNKTSPEDL